MKCVKVISFRQISSEILLGSKKEAVNGRKINWYTYKSITYNRNKPNILSTKCADNCNVDVFLKIRYTTDLLKVEFPQLYPNGRNISKRTLMDLKGFMNLIPTEHHKFYESLNTLTRKMKKIMLLACENQVTK